MKRLSLEFKGSLHPDPARGSRDWDYIAVTPSV